MNEIPDTAEAMEAKATANALPLGWRLLFAALVLWGAAYLFLYSPWSTGWTQVGEYQQAVEAKQAATAESTWGVTTTATILFTVLPTAAALWLWGRNAKKRA